MSHEIRPLPPGPRRTSAWLLCLVGAATACSETTSVRTPPSAASTAVAAAAEEWTYEVLGNPGDPNDPPFSVQAINDAGDVTGVGRFTPVVAWRWHEGAFQITPPTATSWAGGYGINNKGDVFGIRTSDQLSWFGMSWHFNPDGSSSMVSFPPLTPGARVDGADINDSGYAIGSQCVTYGAGFCDTRALLWRPKLAKHPWNPVPEALGPVGDIDRAIRINNAGTSLGHTTFKYNKRAWLALLSGTMALLPLGSEYDESWPGDIDDFSMSVGVAHRKRDNAYRFV